MDILFQSHHAVISDNMARRAERLVRKIARRTERVITATVRFEQDGPTRRVELTFLLPHRVRLAAAAEARNYGPALNEAGQHMTAQLARRKRTPKARGRPLART
jgi:ribosome-associated translation inhibitor RaiA